MFDFFGIGILTGSMALGKKSQGWFAAIGLEEKCAVIAGGGIEWGCDHKPMFPVLLFLIWPKSTLKYRTLERTSASPIPMYTTAK